MHQFYTRDIKTPGPLLNLQIDYLVLSGHNSRCGWLYHILLKQERVTAFQTSDFLFEMLDYFIKDIMWML